MPVPSQQLLLAGSGGAPIYSTWNPADKSASVTLSGGNLTASVAFNNIGSVRSTVSKSSGKWYWEVTVASISGGDICAVGIAKAGSVNLGSDANSWAYWSDGSVFNNNVLATTGTSWLAGSVTIGIAVDVTAGTVAFYLNNVLQYTYPSGVTGPVFACLHLDGTNGARVGTANFGASALTYSPPSGFNPGLYA